jgi:hypothetical protein
VPALGGELEQARAPGTPSTSDRAPQLEQPEVLSHFLRRTDYENGLRPYAITDSTDTRNRLNRAPCAEFVANRTEAFRQKMAAKWLAEHETRNGS